LTGEIVSLASWLEELADPGTSQRNMVARIDAMVTGRNPTLDDELTFVEPSLSFRVEERLSVPVPLIVDLNPEAGPSPGIAGDFSPITLRLALDRQELRNAVTSLRADAERYPAR
jgi:hypothetical protein